MPSHHCWWWDFTGKRHISTIYGLACNSIRFSTWSGNGGSPVFTSFPRLIVLPFCNKNHLGREQFPQRLVSFWYEPQTSPQICCQYVEYKTWKYMPHPVGFTIHLDKASTWQNEYMLTKIQETENILGKDLSPTIAEPRCHEVYLLTINTGNMESIFSTDIPCPLPYTSVQEYCYIFFLYMFDANAILMEPMRNCKDAEITRAYAKLCAWLDAVGIKPNIDIIYKKPLKQWRGGSWRKKQRTKHVHRVEEVIDLTLSNVLSRHAQITSSLQLPLQIMT